MIQTINTNLKTIIPYYTEALELSMKAYKNPVETATNVVDEISTKVKKTQQSVIQLKKEIQSDIFNFVENASDQLLKKAQKFILPENQKPSIKDKKELKKRFMKMFNKLIGDYVMFYVEQANKYNKVIVQRGKEFYYANILPLYITLKATLLVSKEIMLQMLENRIDDMKMTYSVSKDTVTMLIGGKFEEDKIIEKISAGMENFKELTVKVVKKGLQIKVDKQSLYQNYQAFSAKLLQIIREMRQKGTQKIVSARQKSAEMYKNVLNRIREKQISLKMQYKELQDKVEDEDDEEEQ